MPPADMFWSARFAKVTDPFGHEWSIATHVEDVSPEECSKRDVVVAQPSVARLAREHAAIEAVVPADGWPLFGGGQAALAASFARMQGGSSP